MSSSLQRDNGQKVRFGAGIRHQVAQEMTELGLCRALVLSTPGRVAVAQDVASSMGPLCADVFAGARMHTPVDVTQQALAVARDCSADSVVSVGGGSTTGLGKALALLSDLPQVVVPTTYAGSEATSILGQTQNGVKTTMRDKRILPKVVLYDPELAAFLPPALTVNSALNAMAHAVEGLYAKDRTAETSALALEGLHAMVLGLPAVVSNPRDLNAREATLRGAWACGAVLDRVGMALHHKLCHTIGGALDLPHAETHAVLLPHAVAYNEREVPDLLAPINAILGSTSPSQGLWVFSKSLGAPLTLQGLGMVETDIDRVVEAALETPYWNPRKICSHGLRALLSNAFVGKMPMPETPTVQQ